MFHSVAGTVLPEKEAEVFRRLLVTTTSPLNGTWVAVLVVTGTLKLTEPVADETNTLTV